MTSLTGIPNDLEETCVLFFKKTEREILNAEYVLKYIRRATLEQGPCDVRYGFLSILQPHTQRESNAPLIAGLTLHLILLSGRDMAFWLQRIR